MVLEAFGQALLSFGNPQLWLFMTFGVVVGLTLGVIPGLSGITGLALALPFVFVMSPHEALPLMVALVSVSYTGGSISAILLNVPGTSSNAATVVDGYPMSQKGEAGRALGAALMSSTAGGAVTVIFALLMVPLILPMVMAITSPDMVFLVLLGLAFVATLGKGAMVRGLMSGGLGLAIALIGLHARSGVPRFTFDMLYLYDGLPLAAMALGLFAIPEMVALAARGGTIARVQVFADAGGVWEGAKDVYRHWWLWLRSSAIGYVIGLVPGIGSASAIFIAYGHAKQTSKTPEKFGTGCVEGIIAPESANNAKEAGALLTTMALGIPGSADGAFFLGAFLVLGIIPGPEMITKNLDLSLTLLLIIIVANLLGGGICFALASRMAKIALIPSRVLVPLVLAATLVGAYASRKDFADILVVLVIGALGLAMKEFGYNRPALLLGFVLGSLFEKYLYISLAVGGPLFFIRPLSLILILIFFGVVGYSPIKDGLARYFRGRSREAKEAWN
ncbi:MAG: tripartite tricarboxylate transporter permease [Chloroflexi bacterium]|nr:tripartite tricarboxylate transporter permease [Chloroflexota bacterium]